MGLFYQVYQCLLHQQQRGVIRVTGKTNLAKQTVKQAVEQQFKSLEQLTNTNFNVAWFTLPDSLSNEDHARQNEWRLKKYKTFLGEEFDFVVIDLHQGLNLEAIGALAGTIKLNGAMVLLTPEDQDWINMPDPEAQRIASYPFTNQDIANNTVTHIIEVFGQLKGVFEFNLTPEGKLQEVNPSSCSTSYSERDSAPSEQSYLHPLYRTKDQEEAGIALEAQLLKNKSITVITADRGRGKSTLLGIMLAKLTLKSHFKIAVIGASSGSLTVLTNTFNEQLQAHMSGEGDSTSSTQATLERLAPDALISESNLANYDLIVIDEAASFPISVTQAAFARTSKLVLATTVHGYEGTGRGFEYKLKPWLKHQSLLDPEISYVELEMSQPIRWNNGDYLEAWTNEVLLLNASVPELPDGYLFNENHAIECKPYSAKELKQSGMLKDVFGLLVQAHYQTSPSDLRAMLDAPDLMTFVTTVNVAINSAPNTNNANTNNVESQLNQANQLKQGKQGKKRVVIATALVSLEGRLPDDLADEIWQSRRRPRGHLCPQSLIAHCGYLEAHAYSYARVIRIAVHPEHQGEGLGTKLLDTIQKHAVMNSIDFVATSFGLSDSLLGFWIKNDFAPVRLGLRPETSTGEVSLLMLKPISKSNQMNSEQEPNQPSLRDTAQHFTFWALRFNQTLKQEIALNLRDSRLPTTLIKYLNEDVKNHDVPTKSKELNTLSNDFENWTNQQNLKDILVFSEHFRSADSCVLAFGWGLNALDESDRQAHPLLVNKFVRGTPNKALIKEFKFSGEKQLINHLRSEAKSLFSLF